MDGPTGPVTVTNHWPISCLFFNWKFAILKASLGSKRKAPHTASSWKPSIAALYREPFFNAVNTSGLLQNTQQTNVTNGLHTPKQCQNMLDWLWTLILICVILVHLFAILRLYIWFHDSSSNAFNWNIAFLLATTFLCYAILVPYMPDFEEGGGRGKRTLNAPRQKSMQLCQKYLPVWFVDCILLLFIEGYSVQ